MRLGVNIDHVATVRQARGIDIPDPVAGAVLAELAGADGITVHLREDRRHIQDRDVLLLKETVKTKLNLEMANSPEIVEFALNLHPEDCCLVPEKREEVTTEGGLDVAGQKESLAPTIGRLQEGGIRVSLFIDPEERQLRASREVGAEFVELHTGRYAEARGEDERARETRAILEAVCLGGKLGLRVNAGHGLNYRNVEPIAKMSAIEELNIGHAIIARAVLVGMERAVREMRALMTEARG